MAQDALQLITAEHERFREALDRYEEIDADDHDRKGAHIEELIGDVTRHGRMEEEAFYPAVLERLPEAEDEIREDIEEHHVLDVLMAELKGLPAEHEQFDAKVEVFAEILIHHLDEEEEELFPTVRAQLDADFLEGLTGDLRAARERADAEPGRHA